jgi:predicted outer membrane protein
MKMCKKPAARLARVLQAGTVLGVALAAASTLQAQTYDKTQPSGVTTPAGVTQPSGLAQPLGTTETPAPLSFYPTPLPAENPPENFGVARLGVKGFLQDAARENQAEIAFADVAEVRAHDAAVQRLAETARLDEARNNGRLQAMAEKYGIKLRTSPGWMSQREIERLQNASGSIFDKEYTMIVLSHAVKCINRYEQASEEIVSPDVATYAEVNLPRLRHQMRVSERAARSVGVDEGTISSILNGLPSEDQGIALGGDKEDNHFTSR